jgi:hypothetical protein
MPTNAALHVTRESIPVQPGDVCFYLDVYCRLAAEGAISAYIHPGSRLGVLLEVNCETDFVAASDKFQALVNAIAMQIAASPSVSDSAAELCTVHCCIQLDSIWFG